MVLPSDSLNRRTNAGALQLHARCGSDCPGTAPRTVGATSNTPLRFKRLGCLAQKTETPTRDRRSVTTRGVSLEAH